MKKINNTTLIIGGAIVLIGGLAFMLLRKPKSKLDDTTASDDKVDTTKPENSSSSFELVGFAQKPGSTSISVLKMPSLMSGVSKQLESFITVYARPASSKGWSEISEDNETILGYLPNEVLRKL